MFMHSSIADGSKGLDFKEGSFRPFRSAAAIQNTYSQVFGALASLQLQAFQHLPIDCWYGPPGNSQGHLAMFGQSSQMCCNIAEGCFMKWLSERNLLFQASRFACSHAAHKYTWLYRATPANTGGGFDGTFPKEATRPVAQNRPAHRHNVEEHDLQASLSCGHALDGRN